MATYIQVNARFDKTLDNGSVKKVTEPYLVDALSCTEAEARVTEELRPFLHSTADLLITSVGATKIREIFFKENSDDPYYKVKVNFITINERTGKEQKSASFILVQAATLDEALTEFHKGMKGTLADYEVASITETKIVDVYKLTPLDGQVS